MFRRFFSNVPAHVARYFFAGLAAASLAAHADQLQQHQQLVETYIQQQHADPLVADCAAHANFVVSTVPGYDSVSYADDAFDADHAHIEPWQKPFDDGKQKIEVATVVTLDGIGHRPNGRTDVLHIRCGYNEGRLMAFGYTSPLPQVEPVRHARRTSPHRGRHTAHASAKTHTTRKRTSHARTAQHKRGTNVAKKPATHATSKHTEKP